MVDLRKTAILLIYQDGSYDYEEVSFDIFHLPYFRKLKKRSKKVRETIKDLDLNRCNHSEVFTFLSKAGVIEIFNYSLAKMVACPEVLKSEFVPFFVVSIPYEFASEEQKESFYSIIRGINPNLLYFGQCDENGYILEDDVVRERILNDDLMEVRGGR